MTVKSTTSNEANSSKPSSNPFPKPPQLPSVVLSSLSDVDEAFTHYIGLGSDFDHLPEDLETTDPLLWKSLENALTEARNAAWAQVDAHCAHVVAQTLLVDREYRKEQKAKRGSIKDSDQFTALLSDYADAVHGFREAQVQGGTAENTTPEERKASQAVRQAEQAIDAFLEAFYAEPSGLKE